MTLREATEADASSLAAISIEVWVGTYLKRGVSGFFADFALEEFTPAKFKAILEQPSERLIVSQNEEGIDGFIRITCGNQGPVAGCSDTEISTFYVQPRHHGAGIGKALLAAALEHCRARGAVSVWLTTNSQNSPAIGFYHAQGFETIGQTEFRIGNEGYLNDVFLLEL